MKFLLKSFKLCILLILIGLSQSAFAQEAQFTRADTLRGSITPQRAWWEVVYYDLNVTVMPQDSAIRGYNEITYRVTDEPVEMQIDLQQPLRIDQITQNGKKLDYHRVDQSNAYFVDVPRDLKLDSLYTITVYYHGQPRVAVRAPWDGGFVWTQDSLGNPWVATAVQGLGASAWWPNKDHQTAEPDSMSINITVPDPMVNVSNGRLRDTTHHKNGMTTWSWFVSNPINNYNIAVNAGNYVNFTDTYEGKKGTLDLSYWVLESDLKKAKEQFQQVKPMMRCFEKWFGPYPFYEDSFKLVQTPYLGMEHQSAVAYGNGFENGYRGTDLSGTGWGLKWDFIIIHEAAHEWWGNNITSKDVADMWVHESFANYAEGIYTECLFSEEAGAEYIIGLRERILNNEPIIGEYGVNSEGSGDMYYKGSNMLHTIRHIISDDSTWKSILLGLQKDFYHQTVTGQQVENYIDERVEYDLDPVFDQYLRHTNIPVFQYYIEEDILHYRWTNAIDEFDMPIKVTLDEGSFSFVQPVTGEWKTTKIELENPESFKVNKNFYVKVESVDRDLSR
ncbi:MAG TPA: M1 family metallopeptidase [Balneolaceae bacterium]